MFFDTGCCITIITCSSYCRRIKNINGRCNNLYSFLFRIDFLSIATIQFFGNISTNTPSSSDYWKFFQSHENYCQTSYNKELLLFIILTIVHNHFFNKKQIIQKSMITPTTISLVPFKSQQGYCTSHSSVEYQFLFNFIVPTCFFHFELLNNLTISSANLIALMKQRIYFTKRNQFFLKNRSL